MVKIVVDTSIFIEEVRMGSPFLRELASKAQESKVKLLVPTVVIGELWAGESMKLKEKQRAMLEKLRGVEIFDIDVTIACKYGELRRDKQVFGNDAWIAASCLVKEARLATLNKKDFEKVRGLRLYEKLNFSDFVRSLKPRKPTTAKQREAIYRKHLMDKYGKGIKVR